MGVRCMAGQTMDEFTGQAHRTPYMQVSLSAPATLAAD